MSGTLPCAHPATSRPEEGSGCGTAQLPGPRALLWATGPSHHVPMRSGVLQCVPTWSGVFPLTPVRSSVLQCVPTCSRALPALSWLAVGELHLHPLLLGLPHAPCFLAAVQPGPALLSAPSLGHRPRYRQPSVLTEWHVAGAPGEGQCWVLWRPSQFVTSGGLHSPPILPLSPASAFTTCLLLTLAPASCSRF